MTARETPQVAEKDGGHEGYHTEGDIQRQGHPPHWGYAPTGTSTDRGIIAGAVAAFLFDLTDPANVPHDAVSYPGSYIRDIVKTCYGKFDGIWKRAYSVEHLIYCFGQNVDGNVASTYFPYVAHPAEQIESASEPGGWSASAIRSLWLQNLFGQY